jgi:nucleoside-diphosphate-sugar epimerase
MPEKERVLVMGAGGFIGHYLTKYLVENGGAIDVWGDGAGAAWEPA